MSPGPSLAVVLRNTMAGGKRMGVATGVGHGIGFGIYAFATAAGLSVALAAHPATGEVLRWGGAALLVYLGFLFLSHARAGHASSPGGEDGGGEDRGAEDGEGTVDADREGERAGFVQGFLIALFNPKILAWMLAIYSPFIEAGFSAQTLVSMGVLALAIDMSWYVGVATVLSNTGAIDRLRAKAHLIDGAMGVLMFIFAGLLAAGVL